MARLRGTTGDPVMPGRLRVFDPVDWVDAHRFVDELPLGWSYEQWWNRPELARCQWRWKRARVAWYRANGVNILDVLREQVRAKQAGVSGG